MLPPPKLSLVIPAYNEEKRLPEFLAEARRYLNGQFGRDYQILVVDDGSRDGTAEVAKALLGDSGLIRLEQNAGKGAAVRAGMLKARGELVLFADADGATPMEEEQRLRAAVNSGADIAIGSRAKGGTSRFILRAPSVDKPIANPDPMPTRSVFPHRFFLGRVYAAIVNGLLSLDVRDTQCGFKMFRSHTVKPVFFELTTQRFGFDVEVLVRARELGYRLEEIGVGWNEKAGSKVSVLTDSFRMLAEVLAVRRAIIC